MVTRSTRIVVPALHAGGGQTLKHNRGRTERCTCVAPVGPRHCERVAEPDPWPGPHHLIQVRTVCSLPQGCHARYSSAYQAGPSKRPHC